MGEHWRSTLVGRYQYISTRVRKVLVSIVKLMIPNTPHTSDIVKYGYEGPPIQAYQLRSMCDLLRHFSDVVGDGSVTNGQPDLVHGCNNSFRHLGGIQEHTDNALKIIPVLVVLTKQDA